MSTRSWRFAAMFLALALFGAWATPAAAQYCGSPTIVPLYAGSIEVGTVTITNDQSTVYVQYDVEDPWEIKKTNAIATLSLSNVPRNSSGPITSYFPARASFSPTKTNTTLTLNRNGSLIDGATAIIVANAKVVRSYRCGTDTRAAWGGTRLFPSSGCGSSGANYLTHTIQSCGQGGE